MGIEFLEIALSYHARGVNVVPIHQVRADGACTCGSKACGKIAKHPRVSWTRYQSERVTEEEIQRWWTTWPEANIGLVTGQISGVVGIDIDGEQGLRSLEEIGLPVDDFPYGPAARSGSGHGAHHIMRYPAPGVVKTCANVIPKVDLRSDGGLLVLPPSLHVSGNRYEWLEGRSILELDPPDFAWERLLGSSTEGTPTSGAIKPRAWYEILLAGVAEPGRNVAATRLAGRYVNMFSYEETWLLLRAWNRVNLPPMEEGELRVIFESIWNRDKKTELQTADERRAEISRVTELNFLDAKIISGDVPLYELTFAEGVATLTSRQMNQPSAFQCAIMDATKHVVRRLGSRTAPTHEHLIRQILSVCEEVDSGVEATSRGEVIALLRDFANSQIMLERVGSEADVPSAGPFIYRDQFWFSLADLLRYAQVSWMNRVSMRDMAQRLTMARIPWRKFQSVNDEFTRWGVGVSEIGLNDGATDEAWGKILMSEDDDADD